MSWCWGHRGEQHKRLFRDSHYLGLPGVAGGPRAFTAGPRVGSSPVAARESVPSEGGRELSLQDGSARLTAALAGRAPSLWSQRKAGRWGEAMCLTGAGGGAGGGEIGASPVPNSRRRRVWPGSGPPASRDYPHQQPPTQRSPAGRAPAVRGTRMTAPRPLAAQVRAPIPGALPLAATAVGVAGSRAGSSRPGFPASSAAPPPARPAIAREGGGNRAPPARGEAKSGARRVRDGGGPARQPRGCPAGCLRSRLPPPLG